MSRRSLTLTNLLAVLALLGAGPAHADIFWANEGTSSIGRASDDGTSVNPSFIAGVGATGVAVDATHIYWTAGSRIGRANLDGSAVEPSFITGADRANGVAVDANHVYWANEDGDTIGRANLDATGVDQSFITGATIPSGPAVDGSSILWANQTTVGRASLDGSSVTPTFIDTGSGAPYAVALDARHVYWASYLGGVIGRANLDGSGVEPGFISLGPSPGALEGVAADPRYIYWAHYGADTIGRAALEGSAVDDAFITGVSNPAGIAVSPSVGGTVTAKSKQPQSGGKVKVKIKVVANEPVVATITGKVKLNPTFKLRKKTLAVGAGQTKYLTVRPQKRSDEEKLARALKKGKKATAKLRVKLVDDLGAKDVTEAKVTLRG